MRDHLLRGLWVAALTPLAADRTVDVPAFARHCRWLIEQGCDGVALFGTSGEGPHFTVRERIAALEGVLAAGVAPERVVVGTGCVAIPDAVELTRHAVGCDVAAAMLLPTFFVKKQRDAEVEAGIAAVVEAVNDPRLRLVLYHIPSWSAVEIGIPAVKALRRRFGAVIAGIKDSSGDWSHFETYLDAVPELRLFTGSEHDFGKALARGAAGTICGLGNVAPRTMAAIKAGGAGAAAAQREIESLVAFYDSHSFLPTVKAMLATLTGEPGWRRLRPPLVEPDAAETAEIAAATRTLLQTPKAA
jgi:4-hydroxy-tetrahydrodipicolinate synthase